MKAREQKRLEKELADITALAKDSLISAITIDDDLTHWRGILLGPEGTPYEGGTFSLDIRVSHDYPYTPPKIRFETKIWHPNISSQTGAICLDVLGKEWSPALTIRTALLSIQALLSSPEPSDPQDAEVAGMYLRDKALFNQTARHWTSSYASAGGKDLAVSRLKEMGFDGLAARKALECNDWDETRALNSLLGAN